MVFVCVQDLTVLNRDLSKVIVLDDLGSNLVTHQENWLRVPSFKVCSTSASLFFSPSAASNTCAAAVRATLATARC
jgi:hypothetical protein